MNLPPIKFKKPLTLFDLKEAKLKQKKVQYEIMIKRQEPVDEIILEIKSLEKEIDILKDNKR